MSIKGIDVSTHQGAIDWKKVKQSGIQFAIIRSGYGDVLSSPGQIDKKFHTNMKQAITNGIPVGVYHFSYAGTEKAARREAEGVLSLIQDYSLTYPVYFDYEYDSDRLAGKLGKTQLTNVAIAFMDTIQKAGYQAGVYTNLDFVRSRYDMPRLKKYELWLAHYGTDQPGVECGLHQTSESGTVPGISGKVDLDTDRKGYIGSMPLSLDTSEYTFKEVGQVYQFLACGTEKPEVSSSNPDVVSVKFNGQDSRGYLYEIKALKPGLSTITAKTSTKTAGFRASIGCQLDTHGVYKCRVGQQYTFLCRSVKAPNINVADIHMVTVNYAGRDSRGHLFTLKAKNLGQTEITASLGNFKDSFTVEVI